jgi:hypothetical protein
MMNHEQRSCNMLKLLKSKHTDRNIPSKSPLFLIGSLSNAHGKTMIFGYGLLARKKKILSSDMMLENKVGSI